MWPCLLLLWPVCTFPGQYFSASGAVLLQAACSSHVHRFIYNPASSWNASLIHHHQARSHSSFRYVLRHDTLQEAFLEVKSLRAGPWSYLILCRSDSACAHRHSVNVCRTDLVPNSRGSAQMLGSDSHQYVSLFVTETSTRETKHHTWRVGKLRFITPASPEELTLQALSPEQRGYRVFIDRL